MSIEKVEVIIGCEIHTQLLTATKAFCACENRYGGMPNSRVCPVCLGLPGAMPRISNEYVKLGAVAGYALNCKIASFTKFDRKHYFYPDLAKGYQITQYDIPLCQDGLVELRDLEGNILRSVRVERIHLEEDVGKSLHLEGAHSYIDYNRSGTPLIEIVTKPDMRSPEEAALFMQTVQEILRYVGITKGNLEEGNMRCDANINLKITEDGKEYRTPISEIKNLNSFRAIKDACNYEIKRQKEEFINDIQEYVAGYKRTMGWDEEKGETVIQRTKNSFVDYRFVVEPDIKPFYISEEFKAEAFKMVGELPAAKRERLKKEFGLSDFDVQTLTSSRELVLWFEKTASLSDDPKKAANWILAEVLAVLNEKNIGISELNITPEQLSQLINAISRNNITGKQGKEVFALMLETGKNPQDIIKEKGFQQVSDQGEIETFVEQAINANPKAVEDFKKGKTNVVGWLMGQVMKLSRGQANPETATRLLKKRLSEITGIQL